MDQENFEKLLFIFSVLVARGNLRKRIFILIIISVLDGALKYILLTHWSKR